MNSFKSYVVKRFAVMVAVGFAFTALLVSARQESAHAANLGGIVDSSLLCVATSSEGGSHDVRFVLAPDAVSDDYTDEEACQHFQYELEGETDPDFQGAALMNVETFSLEGYCGDNSAYGLYCDSFGGAITANIIGAASEEANHESTCLGIMHDGTNVQTQCIYYLK